MGDNRRKRRYRDFQRRVRFAPDKVYKHMTRHWRYIPIHPFGDEIALLNDLEIIPIDCWKVDAWWEIYGDVTLVESCVASKDPLNRAAGLYVTRAINDDGRLALYALLDVPFITRALFETVLLRFAELGFPSKAFYAACPKKHRRYLGSLKYHAS